MYKLINCYFIMQTTELKNKKFFQLPFKNFKNFFLLQKSIIRLNTFITITNILKFFYLKCFQICIKFNVINACLYIYLVFDTQTIAEHNRYLCSFIWWYKLIFCIHFTSLCNGISILLFITDIIIITNVIVVIVFAIINININISAYYY